MNVALTVGQKVILPRGLKVGMGTLKSSVNDAVVLTVEHNDQGGIFYRVGWTDSKKKQRTTYVTEDDVVTGLSGLGHLKYSVGQRVIENHFGPGTVTMVRGIHVGVKLDDGKYMLATSSDLRPADTRQRMIQGGVAGLGSSEFVHEAVARDALKQGYRLADVAATQLKNGQCERAYYSLFNGYTSYGVAAASRDAGATQAGDQIQQLWERLLNVSIGTTAKCVRKKR